MLQHLSVRNLAIVEEATAAFGPGLNIITGETGAGKSILMGALDLVLGGRADKSAIREGAAEAWVEASFSLSDSRAVDALLDAGGLPPCEEGSLLVRRSVAATGAGRCLVNDAPATAQTLRKLGSLLVDIHGPYDHQSLLDPDFQRDILDAYGHCAPQLDEYAHSWQTLKALEFRLRELQGDSADIAAEIDRLQFIVDEISRAGLTEADESELVEQHAQAANAEQILSLGSAVTGALTDGDTSAFDVLANVQSQLAELARILPAAVEWKAGVQEAAVQLQELGRAINDRLSRIDADPARFQQLEERMTLVQRLKRKYGHTVGEVLATLKRHQTRLHDLATRTEQVACLQTEIAAANGALSGKAAALSKSRAKAAGKLARAITSELHDLGFLKAGFSIGLADCAPGPRGADEVSFGFAPNPGEPMRPLKAIASSGEIARVMLAVKAVLAAHDSIPVLVFDEIDANIGGEVGRAVGQKLRKVAENHQVISITHLPQSAVYGQQHLVVSKEVVKGRTKMRIEALGDAQRVDEIARMLGGKGLTSVIESHARELLASAK
ncbi:MAG: DNA repair protein RecN [Kiritimatiellae bacterium]|nr:DNA repair protein RecN [Kiritimatiellia bacterium]